jgi:protein-arginine kinase activator protein McsA
MDLNDFVLGVLLTSLVAVALIGMISRFIHWRNEQNLKRLVTVCRLCGHVFLNQESIDVVDCAACHAVNRRNGNGKLG